MVVKQTRKSDIHWFSYDKEGNEWFKAQISLMDFSPIKSTDDERALYVQKLLKGAVRLNSEFLSKWNGFDIKTYLEFPLDWGLGSSSTLTHLVAKWADVNPLLLHFKISEGSGYDVASAGVDSPITYQLIDDTINYTAVDFDPPFKENIFFVHLNKKQSSNDAIAYYFKNAKGRKTLTKSLTEITEETLKCTALSKFIDIMERHELLISEHLGLDTIRDTFFSDFEGGMKSLGAWGGDFMMVASKKGQDYVQSYFKSKGYSTLVSYTDMVFSEESVMVS